MRTNIVIDDKLMRETFRATGLKTKREAVQQGLHEQAKIRKTARQAAMGDLDAMRTDG